MIFLFLPRKYIFQWFDDRFSQLRLLRLTINLLVVTLGPEDLDNFCYNCNWAAVRVTVYCGQCKFMSVVNQTWPRRVLVLCDLFS